LGSAVEIDADHRGDRDMTQSSPVIRIGLTIIEAALAYAVRR
jgi:hypothetical protein